MTLTSKRYTASHWGIYEVAGQAREPGRLRFFSGDPDPSPIGLDQMEPQVTRLRIRRPAVRRSWLEHGPGCSGEGRGNEPLVEVSWDTALGLAASELRRVREEHGNGSIFGGSYGWASAGRFHHAQSQLHRFLNLAGGYVRSVDSYSLGAGRVLMPHIVASMDELNAGHTSWDVIASHTRLFVSFGGVPAKNAQVSPGGSGDHRVRQGLRRAAEAGVRFINIGPVADNLETGSDVEWIPIRPNTDTAMMLGLAYAVYHDPNFNQDFLDRCCTGFTRFAPYLTGEADGVPKTPEWAAAITGVPASRIAALAREMLATRTMVNCAWALQRAAHGEQPFWMVVTLAAMLGQIGLPGGGFGVGYGPMNAMGSGHPMFGGPRLEQGRNPVASFIPVARITDMLLNPGAPFEYNGGTHEYPDIKLIWWAGGNPFHHHQDLNRLRDGWSRPQTIIVQEQYWTPAAKRADIVLPVSTSLERDDIGFATREGFLIAMRKAAEPFGESRSDHAILAGVAAHLGIERDFTEGLGELAWLRRIYGESASRAAAIGIELPGFEEFWEQGVVDLSAYDRPVVMLEAFRADPARHRLATPSGRIEIFSERIAGFGLDDCPGHPVWRPPFEWLGDQLASTYPLHLLSDQPRTRLHSQLDHGAFSMDAKVAGREPVYINPDDAAARGIGDGDLVELFNDRGHCLAGAIVSHAIMPGVVRLATGAWADAQGLLDKAGNPNVLTLDRGASKLSQGCAAQTCLVQARRFVGEVPAVTAHQLPELIRM